MPLHQQLPNNSKKVHNQTILSDEDKKITDQIIANISGITEAEKESIKNFLVKRPALIVKLADNFRWKKKIIARQDKEGWQKLLAEEKALLQQLAQEEE